MNYPKDILEIESLKIVRSDNLNYELHEYKPVKHKGGPDTYEWCWMGFYSLIQNALKAMRSEFVIRQSKKPTLEEITRLITLFDAKFQYAWSNEAIESLKECDR